MLQRTITTLAALSAAATTAVADHRQQLDSRADAEINWSECNKTLVATELPSECADFKVPLDYTNKSDNRTINLQIARIKAKTQPSKGTILLNFGGPGQAGRSSLGSQADLLQAMSGYEYDLAAFDSRGTVDTIPEDCFKTPKAKQEFLESQSIWFDETPDTLSDMWDRAKYNAEECYKAFKDTQEFIGTGFVARDLISVVDALGEDGALRYWGFSYGTTLGATVASMYPERIDKMVLDGVQNPHEYYRADADYEEWIDSDRVFSEIFRSCAKAGPLKCPMAAANFTGEELEEVAWSLAEKLRDDPIPVKGYPPLQYGIMRAMFTSAVYGPTGWPQLATLLSLMYTNQTDTELFTQIYEASLGGLIAAIDTYTPLFGIHGADKTVRLESLEEYLPVQKKLNKISKVMDGAATSVNMACGVWKSDAAGPYTGDFQTKTKNRVLFSSNKYDGHTPLQSAKNVSSGFEGSGMLVVDGFGHTTLSQPSVCTIKHTAAYWHDGSMPEQGFVCDVDGAPYSDYTWVNATLAAYKKHDNSTGNSGDDAGEDKPADVVDDSAASHNTFATSLVAVAMAFALLSTF